MNAEPGRRWQRGTRVRLWTLVPLLVVVVPSLLVGARLVLLPFDAGRGVDAYRRGDFDAAAAVFAGQPAVVPWQADFNHGTALLATIDPDALATDPDIEVWSLWDAVDLLDAADAAAADAEAPREVICRVSTNAAIAHERQAVYEEADAARLRRQAADVRDALAARDAGEDYDPAVIDPFGDYGDDLDPDDLDAEADDDVDWAADEYERAATLRANPACGEAGMPQRQEQNDEAALEDQRRADEAGASVGQDLAEPEPSPGADTDSAEQQREERLSQVNQDASRAVDEEQQSQSSDDESGAESDAAKGW